MLLSNGNRGLKLKHLRHEADDSLQRVPRLRMRGAVSPLLQCVLMAWCLIMQWMSSCYGT